jgi:hypothetical protein
MTDRELLKLVEEGMKVNAPDSPEYIVCAALRARLEQPEPEPVAWIEFDSFMDEDGLMSKRKIVNTWDNGRGEPLYTAPPHFIDPTKVARLMDEAFERGKKEINMEQVKDIVQKLSDSAALNSVPMGWVKKKEWVGLTNEEIKSVASLGIYEKPLIEFTRAIEAKLKEKNT